MAAVTPDCAAVSAPTLDLVYSIAVMQSRSRHLLFRMNFLVHFVSLSRSNQPHTLIHIHLITETPDSPSKFTVTFYSAPQRKAPSLLITPKFHHVQYARCCCHCNNQSTFTHTQAVLRISYCT